MPNFGKLKWKNIQSYGNNINEIDLNTNLKTLIIGTNGNGKSTFINVLSYVLFGKSFDGKTNPQLINSINKNNLWAEVEYDNYKIERGIKPNLFNIYLNGVLIPKPAKTEEYQEHLEKHILKLNFDIFKQTIVLSKDVYTPFMKLPTPKRREVIESLLDLQVFSKMNNILKLKISENDRLLNDVNKNITSEESKKQLIEKTIKNLDEEFEIKKQSKILERNNLINLNEIIENEINDYNDKINFEKQNEEKYKILNEKLNQIKIKLADFDSTIERLNKTCDDIKHKEECPTCKQKINDEIKSKEISELKTEIDKKTNLKLDLNSTNDKILNEIKKLNFNQSLLNEYRDNLNSKYSDLNSNKKIIDILDKEINQKGYEKQKLIDSVNILNKNINEFEKQKEIYLKQKELYNISVILLRDNGIKAKVIESYIPEFNNLINKYLSDMNFYVSFELDENFNEIIKSRHRDNFSYNSFSAGERQRIDLAILFTWRDIARLRNSMTTNLTIYDEVLDASLDSDGVNDLMKIFNGMNNDSIFVISHSQNMEEHFDRIIEVNKIKNFSELKIK